MVSEIYRSAISTAVGVGTPTLYITGMAVSQHPVCLGWLDTCTICTSGRYPLDVSLVIWTSEGLVPLTGTAGAARQGWNLDHQNNNVRHSYPACPYATTAQLAPSVAAHTVEPHYIKFSPVSFQTARTLIVAKDLFEREHSRAPPFLNSWLDLILFVHAGNR